MLEYPLSQQDKSIIEQTQFAEIKARTLIGGLPILTAIPTYSGSNGETVWVKTGTTPNEVYALYVYMENNASPKVFGWKNIANSNLSGYELLSNKDTTTSLGTSDTKYPSQKAVKTYVDNNHPSLTYKIGTVNKTSDNTDATQISHGLGRIPRFLRLTVIADTGKVVSVGTYNGTSQVCIYADASVANSGSITSYTIYYLSAGGTNAGSATFDVNNIDIAWTKTSTPSSTTLRIMWEVY